MESPRKEPNELGRDSDKDFETVEEKADKNEPIDLRDVNPTAVMEHDMPDSYN